MIVETRWRVEHVCLGCVEDVFCGSGTIMKPPFGRLFVDFFPGIEHDKQIEGFRDFLP